MRAGVKHGFYKMIRFSPSKMGALIAGGFRWSCFEGRRLLDLCAGHKDDSEHNNRAAGEDEPVNDFMLNDPSQENGDDRIDVGIGRDFGGWYVAQQPDVGRISDPRSENDEVSDSCDSASSPRDLKVIAFYSRQKQVGESGEGHLPGS